MRNAMKAVSPETWFYIKFPRLPKTKYVQMWDS